MTHATTIVAISTPHGRGAIAVVRMSGAESLSLIYKHLVRKSLSPNHATYCTYQVDGQPLDEVVATYFAAPHSYTGEDMVEISCHGSLYIQQRLLQSLLDDGCQMAAAGEFTQRAFLNGRLDLSQAEAVADLIDSTNQAAHHLAICQMRGGYRARLKSLRERFVELTSLLELELDFSDEEVEFADRKKLQDLLDELTTECSRLAATFSTGNAIKQGVPVAIVGKPNVGKSTLLNALLCDDRAIVSDIPGTTRDTIEDTLILSGTLFRIIDTAGLRQSADPIEAAGIQRSHQAAQKADIVLLIIDNALTDTEKDHEIESLRQQIDLDGKRLIVVYNKCDISSADTSTHPFPGTHTPEDNIQYCSISAKYGDGIGQLKEMIASSFTPATPDEPLVTNLRHHQALTHIVEACDHVKEGFLQQLPADLIVIDLRDALYHLGTITGEVVTDEILSTIFSRFCIGK